jgi:4-hydroxy-2-oxoheptanedioate aldolase
LEILIGSLKSKIKSGKTVVGPFVIIPSASMVDTLGYSGMDFCIIDTEHGSMTMESANDLVIAGQGAGISPIIRVGSKDEWPILRALDIGADGVQVPQVNTREDAEKVVDAAKYAPLGNRGMSIFTRAGRYFSDEGNRHAERQNEETTIIVHIEGEEGLRNLDSIMEVKGIDVLFLGPYDISQSLGIPGDVRNPIVEKALREAADKANKKGRVVGSYAKDVEMGKWLIDQGVQYLSVNVDATIYMQACENIVRSLKI